MASEGDGNEAGLLDAQGVDEVFTRLKKAMPGRWRGAKGPKGQPDAFRSCVSCMLSAQSLDRNTAKASATLFAMAETPDAMLKLSDADIVAAIRPAGLYNMKARNIRRFCETLIARHGGVVPENREELLKLPGIGRKCADIVMSFTFGADIIAVDTHVHRVCNRLGLARGKTEAQTAASLERRAPDWARRDGHFWLIQFGKKICTARRPNCPDCPVNDLCLWPGKEVSR